MYSNKGSNSIKLVDVKYLPDFEVLRYKDFVYGMLSWRVVICNVNDGVGIQGLCFRNACQRLRQK